MLAWVHPIVKTLLILVRTYDYDPGPIPKLTPGQLPPDADPPLDVPDVLPATTAPCTQERFHPTPVYADLM